MKLILSTLLVLALLLGNNIAFGHSFKCDYQRMKDLSVARDAKGKKQRGFYIDDFTKELLFATEKLKVSGLDRGRGESDKSQVIYANIWADSRGDEATPVGEHDKRLTIGIIYERLKKTFPTEDEIQQPFSIPEGGELQIGMSDGSVVTLYSGVSSPSQTTYETPKPHSGKPFRLKFESSFTFELEADTQAPFIANGAWPGLVKTNIGVLDFRLTQEGSQVFQYAANCMTGPGR